MSFNIYNYTILKLDTLELQTYSELKFSKDLVSHQNNIVFINEFNNCYAIFLEELKKTQIGLVLYLPLAVEGRPLRCYW